MTCSDTIQFVRMNAGKKVINKYDHGYIAKVVGLYQNEYGCQVILETDLTKYNFKNKYCIMFITGARCSSFVDADSLIVVEEE